MLRLQCIMILNRNPCIVIFIRQAKSVLFFWKQTHHAVDMQGDRRTSCVNEALGLLFQEWAAGLFIWLLAYFTEHTAQCRQSGLTTLHLACQYCEPNVSVVNRLLEFLGCCYNWGHYWTDNRRNGGNKATRRHMILCDAHHIGGTIASSSPILAPPMAHTPKWGGACTSRLSVIMCEVCAAN